MASDRRQFSTALNKWDQLHTDGHFSAPADDGQLAILLPYDHAKHADTEKIETFEYLTNQTLRLADHILLTTGRKPQLAIDATECDFKEVTTNPAISDVIVVGKGTFSSVEASSPVGWIGWRMLSEQTDHLKMGSFRQLVCGSRRLNLNVPLGAFVVANHQNIFAPIDTYLPARASLRRLLGKLDPVSNQPRMDWHYIKDNFSEEITYDRADQLRARIDRIEQHIRNDRLGTILKQKVTRQLGIFTNGAPGSQSIHD